MAEDVKVTNVGGDGDIASEATLVNLVSAIEKLAKQTGADPRSEAAKAQEAHTKVTKEGVKVSRKYQDALKEKTQETEKATATTREFNRAMKGVLMGAVGQVAGSIKNLSNEFLQGGNELNDFTQHLPLIGSYLGPLVQYLDRSVSTFRDLSSTGASFNNSIVDMRQSAINAQLNLDEFASFVGGNSEALRLLGSTVTSGVQEFTRMNKTLKDTGEWTGLKELGFTVEEINEGLLDYSVLQGRLGRRQQQTMQQLAQGSSEYLRQLDLLAKVTGRSRKELEADMQADAARAAFRALEGQFAQGSEELENFRRSMGIINSLPDAYQTAVKDLTDGVAQTAEAQRLLAIGGERFRDAIVSVGQGADPEILRNALLDVANQAEGMFGEGPGAAAMLSQLELQGEAFTDVINQATQVVNQMSEMDIEAGKRQQEASNNLTETMLRFDDAVRAVRANLNSVFIESGLFETLGDGIGNFAEFISSDSFQQAVEDLADRLNVHISKFIEIFEGTDSIKESITYMFSEEGPLGEVLSGLGEVIGDAFEAAITNPKVVAAIAGAMILAGGAAAVGGRVLGGAGKGAGAAIGGIGAGIGKGTGAVISGIGTGLAAAGAKAPLIALGGAAIGGAIAAIAAGFAGASYVLGATLPMLAEGIKSFETLDGDALAQTGDGLVSLSLGLAAFGAGTVVTGIGNLAGNAAEGLASLISDRSPMQKLEEFAKFDIDATRVKNNADALIAFSKAMAASGGGAAAAGFGRIAGNVANGISDFFETDTPYDKIREFGRQDLDAENVIRNAEVVNAMAQALSNFRGTEIPSIDIDREFFFGIDALSKVGPGLGVTVDNLQNLAEIKGLDNNISALRNGFDADNVRTYGRAIEDLVETLEELNQVLADDNSPLFGRGNTSAGDVVQQLNTTNQGNAEGLSKLNSLMSQVASTLQMIYENDQKIERNTSRIQGGNIASGRVSNLTN